MLDTLRRSPAAVAVIVVVGLLGRPEPATAAGGVSTPVQVRSSGVRGQGSGVRGQESEVRGQGDWKSPLTTHHSPLTTPFDRFNGGPRRQEAGLFVTRAEYRVTPHEDRLQITAVLSLRQTAKTSCRLPLPFDGMNVESAELDGKPAPVIRHGNSLALIHDRTGTATLRLVLSTPLHRAGRARVAVLNLPPDAPATMRVELPEGRACWIDGARAKAVATKNGTVRHECPVGNRRRVALQIIADEKSSGHDSVLLADSQIRLRLRAGMAEWVSTTRLHVAGTAKREVVATVPSALRIASVSADGLADWRVPNTGGDDSRQSIRLRFREAWTGERAVSIRGRAPLGIERFWSVPNMAIAGADSHSGRLTIAFPASQKIRADEPVGLRQVSGVRSQGLGAGHHSPLTTHQPPLTTHHSPLTTLDFDFWTQDFEMALVLPADRPAAVVEFETIVNVGPQRLGLNFRAAWPAADDPPQRRLTVPAGWTIRTMTCDGRPVGWTALPVEADVQHVRVNVPRATSATGRPAPARRVLAFTADHPVEVANDPAESTDWKLPVVGLPDCRLMRGRIFVRSQDDEFAIVAASVKGLKPIGAAHDDDRIGFALHGKPAELSGASATIGVRTKSPRLAAEVLSTIHLTENEQHSRHEVLLDPAGGSFRSLDLLLPASAGDVTVRWFGRDARLVERLAGETKAGRQRWTLRFDRPVRRAGRLHVALSSTRANDGKPVPAHRVQVATAARQTGETVLLESPDQRLTATASINTAGGEKPVPLEEAAVRGQRDWISPLTTHHSPLTTHHPPLTTHHSPLTDRVAASFRDPPADCTIAIRETRMERPNSLRASCPSMRADSVVAESGIVRSCVTCRVAIAEAQTLRITLPAESKQESVRIDGRPVEFCRDGSSLLLALSRERRFDGRLEIVYSTPFDSSGFRQAMPTLAAVGFDGRETPISPASRLWRLHHPRELAAVDADGPFTPMQSPEAAGWLPGVQRAALRSQAFFSLLAVALICVIAFLVRQVVRRNIGARRAAIACALLASGVAAVAFASANNATYVSRQSAGVNPRETRAAPLPTSLRAPPDFAVEEFRYLGSDDAAELSVVLDRTGERDRLRLCVILGVFGLLWLLRNFGRRWKTAAAVLGLFGPVLLLPWCPVSRTAILDGVFAGTLCGGAFWFVRRRVLAGLLSVRPVGAAVSPLSRAAIAGALLFAVCGGELKAADSDGSGTPAFVSSASYSLNVSGETVAVNAEFQVHGRASRSAVVTLPLGRVAIRSATLAGQPADVSWQRGENGDLQPAVMVTGTGPQTLRLRLALPVARDGNRRRFVLPVRPAASGRAVLHLKERGTHVAFDGLQGRYVATRSAGTATVAFPVDTSRDVAVVLSTNTNATPAAAVRFTKARTAVAVDNRGWLQRDELTMTVARGSTRQWSFTLPPETRLMNVTGRDVAGWSIASGDDDRRTVRIDFRRTVADATTLGFLLFRTTELSDEAQELAVGFVSPSNAAAPARDVGISAGPTIAVNLAPGKNLEDLRKPQAGADPRLSFRVTAPDATVTLNVRRRASRMRATAEHAALVDSDEIRISTRLTLDFGKSPRSGLPLLLPEGFTLDAMRGDHGARWVFGEEESLGAVVFPRPVAGVVRIVLRGRLRRDPTKADSTLAFPGPMSAGKIDVIASIWPAPGLHADVKSADGWRRLTGRQVPPAISDRLASRIPLGVFRTRGEEPPPIGIAVVPRKARVRVETLTLITVRNDGVHYTLLAKCRGLSAASPTVTLSLPRWLGDQLNFRRDRSLLIQRFAPGAGSDERIRWQVTRLDRRSDGLFLAAHAALPPAGSHGNQIGAPVVAWQQPALAGRPGDAQAATFEDVAESRQSVVIVNETRHRLTRGNRSAHRVVTVAELAETIALPESFAAWSGRAVDRLRVNPRAGEPQWTVTRFATRRGVAATVKRAELKTLLEADGSWRTQAVYRVHNRGRAFFPVVLPADSRLLRVFVNGRETTASKTKSPAIATPRLIPLDGREHTTVRVLLAGTVAGTVRSRIAIPAPQVVSFADDRAVGIPVERTVWTVHLVGAPKADAHAVDGNLRPANGIVGRSPDFSRRDSSAPLAGATAGRPRTAQVVDALIRANASPLQPASNDDRHWMFPLEAASKITRVSATGDGPELRARTRPEIRISLRGPEEPAILTKPDQPGDLTPEKRNAFEFAVPADAQTLHFEKAGGAPRLTLAVRRAETNTPGVCIAWTIACLAMGAGLLLVFRRSKADGR